MMLRELYSHFLHELKGIYSEEEASAIISLLFESSAGISRSDLIANPSKQVTSQVIQRLQESLKALQNHTPVQYITGEAWFFKMKLRVSPAVLIPRPETEELVAEIIDYLRQKPASSILDIGTGSGCIPIAIRKNILTADVSAVDISSSAIGIARENAAIQQTPVRFYEMDFLDEGRWQELESYDIIVSNPPYIPENEKNTLDKNVTAFEPHLALFVESSRPLLFYEKILQFARAHLKANGKIFMEVHQHYASITAGLFDKAGYETILKKDINGNQRMLIVTRRSL